MKEILMQSTIDYLHPINPELLNNIVSNREFEKKQIISNKEENDITYFIIKDE
jgi:hypothetical protein